MINAVIELMEAGTVMKTAKRNTKSVKEYSMSNKSNNVKRVNVCWELNGERCCKTLSKDEAYAIKNKMKEEDGNFFWFQALDD